MQKVLHNAHKTPNILKFISGHKKEFQLQW